MNKIEQHYRIKSDIENLLFRFMDGEDFNSGYIVDTHNPEDLRDILIEYIETNYTMK